VAALVEAAEVAEQEANNYKAELELSKPA